MWAGPADAGELSIRERSPKGAPQQLLQAKPTAAMFFSLNEPPDILAAYRGRNLSPLFTEYVNDYDARHNGGEGKDA